MGVLEATLLILALKIPIVGLITFVYWLMKEPEPEGPTRAQGTGDAAAPARARLPAASA